MWDDTFVVRCRRPTNLPSAPAPVTADWKEVTILRGTHVVYHPFASLKYPLRIDLSRFDG